MSTTYSVSQNVNTTYYPITRAGSYFTKANQARRDDLGRDSSTGRPNKKSLATTFVLKKNN